MAERASQVDTILSRVELYISNWIDLIFHFGVLDLEAPPVFVLFYPDNCKLQILGNGHLEPGLIARTVKATKISDTNRPHS